jgi:hypothetical protein
MKGRLLWKINSPFSGVEEQNILYPISAEREVEMTALM